MTQTAIENAVKTEVLIAAGALQLALGQNVQDTWSGTVERIITHYYKPRE